MKKLFFVLLLCCQVNTFVSMEKTSLVQTYKNWVSARAVRHFTQPASYNPQGTPLQACRYIPLKELHADLDRAVRNHILLNCVIVPVAGITTLGIAAVLVIYKHL